MNAELEIIEDTTLKPTTPRAKDVAAWLWMVNRGTVLVKHYGEERINAHFASKEAAETYVTNATKP
ncbi:hypothetical protein TUM4438_40460 [Shewanella sairae]|uniref:Uncharacterized protein n=1 Tax=Shewanella sairae TaxID=190310 RepID=A0ABQ4PQC1_9GAMM|nr:hypothetical protein [Shewanella sairae]MCL1132250.1 hypothetical protein [Shewanella sairae]GIU51304.1 hypothetical protein TUM4438_40460 [Shewanella sairae]